MTTSLTSEHGSGRRVSARLSVDPANGRLRVHVDVAPGWHVYAPGADDGVPLSLTIDGESVDVALPETTDGHLSGNFVVGTALTGTTSSTVQLRYQACDGHVCERPEVLDVASREGDPA